MDARDVLDSAAGGWWYPVVVIALVIAGAVWKAVFRFDPDRPGETVLPPWLLTSGAVMAALPFVVRYLADGETGGGTFGLSVVVVLAAMSLATTLRQQAAASRRPPRP
ncbi:hypothetical protein [Streptomyces kanasensis]|uniref:hypothetical protein n=1 Tax=Streptomyces kanasensis TaxID=936756 RepID=UPI0036F56E53